MVMTKKLCCCHGARGEYGFEKEIQARMPRLVRSQDLLAGIPAFSFWIPRCTIFLSRAEPE
jgi:hypothetical protein